MALSQSDRYAEFLASKGRRLTANEARVVEVIFSACGTFDAEDVVTTLLGQASRATVYRTLAKLVEASLLRRVLFNDRYVYVTSVDPDPGA